MASYLVVGAKHGDNCMSVDPNMTTVWNFEIVSRTLTWNRSSYTYKL